MAENFFGLTDTGKVRDNNEDAFIAEAVTDGRFVIACAIDGVGGYSGGEVAADIARNVIIESLAKPSGDLLEGMKDAFVLANKKILEAKLQNQQHQKMACVLTLALADLENNQFYFAHIGDTRLYLLRDKSLVKVSKDHSFVGFLEDSGRIDEAGAMKHLKRNEINKALGFGKEIESDKDYIETGSSPFLPGDTLLLCSDGLTDMVNKEAITEVLNTKLSLEEKASQLIGLANKNGGKDNITVVLVQNNTATPWKPPIPVEAAKGAEVKKKPEPFNSTRLVEKIPEAKGSNTPGAEPKKRSSLKTLLRVLYLLILGSTLFLLWRSYQSKNVADKVIRPVADSTRNAEETTLQTAINSLVGDTLILSDSVYRTAILLSDTLVIPQDSLFIFTEGKITLKGDSSFRGPAIMLSKESRFLFIDGIRFENLDIAISAKNDALYLRNVLFNNCTWPVQNNYSFPDGNYVTGRSTGVYIFHADSLNTPAK